MSDSKGGLGSAIATAMWGVAAHMLFGSPQIAASTERKPKKLLSPVSPGIPLRQESSREKQFARDQAWWAYCQKLIDDDRVTEANVILRKIQEFHEAENPAIEIAVEGYPSRDYVPDEYTPPPPPPPSVKAGQCEPGETCQFDGDSTNWCQLWHQCVRDDRPPTPVTVFSDEDLKALTSTEGSDFFDTPAVQSLVAMLNELTEKNMLTWKLRKNNNRKSYPDGWSWQIIEYLPFTPRGRTQIKLANGERRNTVTRWLTTTSATQFAVQTLRGLDDEAIQQATEGKAA